MSIETNDFSLMVNKMRNLALIAIGLFFLITLVVIILYEKEKSSKEEKIYVVSDAGTYMVHRNDYNLRQGWEVKNHVKIVIQDLFENDVYTYHNNVEASLHLVDNAMGIRIKDLMDKSGLYELLRKENAYTKVVFDSVQLLTNHQPFEVKCYFKQMVMWRGLNQIIPYGVMLSISEDARSQSNPYGLLANRFDLFKYEPAQNGTAKNNPDSLKGFR